MGNARLLLPFTHGIQTNALEYAVQLAKSRNAALVPLSLIQVAKECGAKDVRLEDIQQSKDFLEAVKHKAARYGVRVEQIELYTSDVVESVNALAQDADCEGILLFVREGEDVLLDVNQIKHIVAKVASKHHIIHLQSIKKQRPGSKLLKHVSQLVYGGKEQPTVASGRT
jgi:hypothetical protein